MAAKILGNSVVSVLRVIAFVHKNTVTQTLVSRSNLPAALCHSQLIDTPLNVTGSILQV
jgi:hypothetical protein